MSTETLDDSRNKQIRNGDRVRPTFPRAKERRVATLRAHMAGESIDAALFTSYHNINYLISSTATSAARSV